MDEKKCSDALGPHTRSRMVSRYCRRCPFSRVLTEGLAVRRGPAGSPGETASGILLQALTSTGFAWPIAITLEEQPELPGCPRAS